MKENSFNLFLNAISNELSTKSIDLLSFPYGESLSFFGAIFRNPNKSLSILLAKTSFVFLLISMLFYWFQITFKIDKKALLGKIPYLTMWSANLTLAFLLSIRWIESGHFPLSNLYESLLFLSWSLTTIHLFLEDLVTKRKQSTPTLRYLTLGAITSPVALFTNAFATFSLPQEMQKVTVLVPALQSNWLMMHVSVMITSYAALLSGSLLAVAFLVIKFVDDKRLQKKNKVSNLSISSSEEKTTFSLTGYPKGVCQIKNPFNLIRILPIKLFITSYGSASQALSTKMNSYFPFTGNFQGGNTDSGGIKKGENSFPLLKKLSSLQHVEYPSHESHVVAGEKGSTIDLALMQKEGFIDQVDRKIQSSLLHSKENEIFQQDLLQILDNLSYRAIGLGFALLTIGILSGAVWANEAWGSYWSWDPKETWAFVTWLIFALYLHTRLSKGWVGKESAFVATFGFLVIWFCYLGVNLFGKGLHSYGWFHSI